MGLCVALSVGELEHDQYLALKNAGAARYLLRIETSNPVCGVVAFEAVNNEAVHCLASHSWLVPTQGP
jgi:hypothetical protein